LAETHKPSVDKVFFRQLRAILRIAFPSWNSKESFIVLLHSFFLVLRTVLSIYVAKLDGRIVRDLVRVSFSPSWFYPRAYLCLGEREWKGLSERPRALVRISYPKHVHEFDGTSFYYHNDYW
jgi:hypothetical protein